MMDYPIELPTPIIDNYSYENQSQILRSDLETGLARQRRIYTHNIFTIIVGFVLTSNQIKIFEYFYFNDINAGLSWFNISLYLNGSYELRNARFIQNYEVSSLANDIFKVTSQLEVRDVTFINKKKPDTTEPILFSDLYDFVNIDLKTTYKW